MTDIKLLSMPELPVAVERFILSSLGPMKREGAVTAIRTMLREYARANVAHATAAQAAEIEALRRMVQERDNMLGRKPCAGMNADGNPRCIEMVLQRARAERLAEALRAEVTRLVGDAMQAQAEAKEFKGAGDVYQARAERLAEALREKADKWDRIGDEHGVRQFTGNDHKLFANELRAALRDHDQGARNG